MTKVVAVLMVVAIVAIVWALPALIVMSAWNWIAPQFGAHVHLSFWMTYVALFSLGIVGRFIFGVRDKAKS